MSNNTNNSQTTNPQTTTSQTTTSQTTTSQTTTSQTTNPQTTNPQTTNPQTTNPQRTRYQTTTYKSTNILSDDEENQKREQQIFLRKFNENFVKYKNIIKDKLNKLREDRLKEARDKEIPIGDNRCLTLDNKIYIYNNLPLILGIIFIFFGILLSIIAYRESNKIIIN